MIMHEDESNRIYTSNATTASTEARIPEADSSPSYSGKQQQPVELSFESDEDMDKKPAALLHYCKDVPATSNEHIDDEESIVLAPLGPSRRTTAARDALFSMSPKPMSMNGTKFHGSSFTIQASTSMVKPSLEQLSIPLTKVFWKDNAYRLGHDSMSYCTDETEQIHRPLPYMSAAMLPNNVIRPTPLHDIISDLVHAEGISHTSPNLPLPIVITPIRCTPKVPYKSPFKPIPFKEFDSWSHHNMYSDHNGVSTNGRVLRPIPHFSPMPAHLNTSAL